MAVVLDTTRLNDAEATTNWTKITGGKAPTLNPDQFYQGSNSISVKATTTAFDGPEYTHTATTDFSTTPQMWLAKILCPVPGLISTTRTQAFIARIGSSSTDYYEYVVHAGPTSYPAIRAWLIVAVDPNLVGFRDGTGGTPDLANVDYFAVAFQPTASTLSENIAQDAVDYVQVGQGSIHTGSAGTFNLFRIDDEDDTTNGRAGVIYSIDDELFCTAVLRIGDTNLVEFSDSNQSIVFLSGIVDEGAIGLTVNITNASSDVDFLTCRFKTRNSIFGGNPTKKKHFFDTALDVDGGAETITFAHAHGFTTGDYVQYSDEGGVDTIGLTDTNYYWVRVTGTSPITLHPSRADAFANTNALDLTAATAPGENHSISAEPDNRAFMTVTGTGGAFDADSCIFDTFSSITLTSACTITGGFIISLGNIDLSTGTLDGVSVTSQTTGAGEALLDPLTTPNNIKRSSFNRLNGDFTFGWGHAMRLTSTTGSPFTLDALTFENYWSPADNGWNFHTQTGVEPTTDVITTDAAHGFSDGDAVFYNNEGGTDTVGLTNAAKYYVNAITTTTLSIHATQSAAEGDTSRIALTDGTGGETHSLYSGNAAVFNDSGGDITLNSINLGDVPSVRNGTGSSTTAQYQVTVTIEVKNTAGNAIEGVRVRVETDPAGTLISQGSTNASGIYTFQYVYTADQDVIVKARLKGYNFIRASATIINTGLIVPFTLIRDEAVNLP